MSNGNSKNGVLWKSIAALAGVVITIILTLLATGGSWGRQAEKVLRLEKDAAVQQEKISCHEKELATLKAQWQAIEKQLGDQSATLTKILDRLPPRP